MDHEHMQTDSQSENKKRPFLLGRGIKVLSSGKFWYTYALDCDAMIDKILVIYMYLYLFITLDDTL